MVERVGAERTETELLAIERERLRLERVKLAILAAQYEMQRRAYRRANRSIWDRIEDAIF